MNETVSTLFYPGTKTWDIERVQQLFTTDDAKAILATRVPQQDVSDRIAWSRTTNGVYTVKTGYRLWCDRNVASSTVPQSQGWSKIWRLTIPHKMKIFLWRFCRNNLPVRNRLKARGVNVPIICPMCSVDIEHLLHIFFDCQFARCCSQQVDLDFDMSDVFAAPEWLLHKLSGSSQEELVKICTVLYGIWVWRNKKVWENKVVTGTLDMEHSFKMVKEWRDARVEKRADPVQQTRVPNSDLSQWTPPADGGIKVNVDASWFAEAEIFSMGMVIREQKGDFIEGRTMTFQQSADVFEAECIGLKEALSWVLNREEKKAIVESDSLLAVDAINGQRENVLEVGHIIDQCKSMLLLMPDVKVQYIRRQANKVAHGLARMPCMINGLNVFTSPPTHLVELCLLDIS